LNEIRPQRFVGAFLAVFGLALGAVAGANLVLDPFRAYRVVELEALRAYRDKGVSRIAKAEILEHERCEVAILGTSRAQIALDPRHPAWGAPACNLALTGMGAEELERVLARVLAHPEVRRLVLALDFASFGRGNAPHEDFARSRFDPGLSRFDYHAGLLLGSDATGAALRMLRDLRSGQRAPYTELGLTDPSLRGQVGDRERFVWALSRTLESLGGAEPFRYDPAALAATLRAIRTARDDGRDVLVLILPSHALYYEAFHRFGVWRDYERWLVELVAGLEPDGEPRLAPLWDFTAYSEATSERVPESGTAADMRWHWDAVHVKRALGDAALERALGDGREGAAGGIALEGSNVARQIQRLHDQRARYFAAHADQLSVLDEAQTRAGVGPRTDLAHSD
jgi:hypothetical protein